MEDWAQVNDFRHVHGIKYIASNQAGTRLIVIDAEGDGFVYNPVSSLSVV